jgi:hypothetical protein
VCDWRNGGAIEFSRDHQFITDFLVHEMTHQRQRMLFSGPGKRGVHRDVGWYGAIAEAAPRYLGVSFPEAMWPMQKPKPGRMTEVEACHWPHSFRPLIADRDPRLKSSVDDAGPPDYVQEMQLLDGTTLAAENEHG